MLTAICAFSVLCFLPRHVPGAIQHHVQRIAVKSIPDWVVPTRRVIGDVGRFGFVQRGQEIEVLGGQLLTVNGVPVGVCQITTDNAAFPYVAVRV